MGTPQFALPTLELLYNSEMVNILAVITQPDRRAGRGNKIQQSPIKKFAVEHNIPVYQPEELKEDEETLNFLKSSNAEAFVTAAFGQILSDEVLEMPKYGTINLHASLLPKYRGANPIQWCIIKGDKISGVTTMLTCQGVDSGDILIKHEIEVDMDDDTVILTEKMSQQGAQVMLDTLIGLKNATIVPVAQDHNLATKAPKLKKSLGNIKWEKSTFDIHNMIRGRKPWPGAFTYYKGEIIKLHKTRIPQENIANEIGCYGSIKAITKESIQVYTGDGYIDILELQPPNKSIMKAADWARGIRLEVGDSFTREIN